MRFRSVLCLFAYGGGSLGGFFQIDLPVPFLHPDQAAFGVEVERGDFLRPVVHDHQHAFVGEPLHLELQFRTVEAAAYQQTVVEVNGQAVTGELSGHLHGVLSFEHLRSVLFLVAEAEVEEQADNGEHAEGEQSVANHELLLLIVVR